MSPPQWAIDLALETAELSSCRSRRGVVIYLPAIVLSGTLRLDQRVISVGFNGPPPGFDCAGDCQIGTCGRRAIHAEMRALRRARPSLGDMVHVELASGGGVVPCVGPRCEQCSKHIVDSGTVRGVWLFQSPPRGTVQAWEYWAQADLHPESELGQWRYYTAAEFHHATLRNRGLL